MTLQTLTVICPSWCSGSHLPVVGKPDALNLAPERLRSFVCHTAPLAATGQLTVDLVSVTFHPEAGELDEPAGISVYVEREDVITAETAREWASILASAADYLDSVDPERRL